MGLLVRGGSGSADLELFLERGDLLPDRLVEGRLVVRARSPLTVRRAVGALIGTERRKVTIADPAMRGAPRTVVRTHELPRVELDLGGPFWLAPGEVREIPVSLPVPPLGPATLASDPLSCTWTIEVHLDVPGFDPGVAVDVRLLQPSALLRAGVVRLAQFALYEAAGVDVGDVFGEIVVEPAPLCLGGPYRGELRLTARRPMRLQEIRLGLAVRVIVSESGGHKATFVPWEVILAGPRELPAGETILPFAGDLPPLDLPTVELPHGRCDARLRVTLARPWARDTQLERDVALATTSEL
jgi:hypothetical protein